MAARAVASPTISFGLISVPTKAYVAASSESFSFNMITPAGNRIKQSILDAVTEEPVSRGDCLKGYEYEKDKFVTFKEEEIDSLSGDKSNAIELSEFVDDSVFNPVQVEKSYYLAPDKGAEKTYLLLARALEKMGKVAVGKWYARGKDHLVLLKPTNGHLTMFQMYYANEVRAFEYQFSDACEPKDQEIDLAKRLISQLSSDKFDVKKYCDEFAERVRTAIDTKLSGGELQVVASSPKAQVMDLFALLQASINATADEKKSASTQTAAVSSSVALPPPDVTHPKASSPATSSAVPAKKSRSKKASAST